MTSCSHSGHISGAFQAFSISLYRFPGVVTIRNLICLLISHLSFLLASCWLAYITFANVEVFAWVIAVVNVRIAVDSLS